MVYASNTDANFEECNFKYENYEYGRSGPQMLTGA